MMRLVSKLIFRILGWSVIGHTNYPRKSLIIAAPHTSNWDFLFGRCYAYIVGFSPKYLIKSELFLPILGKLIKINGGIPVYRDSNNNLVEQISKKINSSKELAQSIQFKKNKTIGIKIKNIGEKILKKTIKELDYLINNEFKKT